MSTTFERIRVLFPDHLGLARGKYVPPYYLHDHGSRFCITLFALTYDRTMTDAPGAKLLEGLPDCELRVSPERIRPSWQKNTGVVVGDLYFEDEPLQIAPRYVLRKAVQDWETLGYTPKVGIELEAYVMQPDGKGGWEPWNTPGAYVYGTGYGVDPAGLLDEIMSTAEMCELPVEAINSEFDASQFELTLRYGDVLETVDNILLFKLMAREIAAKHGLLLTFLGKPIAGRSGSGLHVNFSLEDKQGHNAYHDAASADGLSALAHQSIAGMLHHHTGMSALLAPTVNSYKRLRPGGIVGYWANWGYDHRAVTVRVPGERGKATHLEHRTADGCANPYFAVAAVLQAARLGVVNKLTPPPAETGDGFETINTDVHIPDDLNQALNALEADAEFIEAFGRESAEQFIAIKRFEWDKYINHITDWELDFYLPFL
jgi:glutamine synthetase